MRVHCNSGPYYSECKFVNYGRINKLKSLDGWLAFSFLNKTLCTFSCLFLVHSWHEEAYSNTLQKDMNKADILIISSFYSLWQKANFQNLSFVVFSQIAFIFYFSTNANPTVSLWTNPFYSQPPFSCQSPEKRNSPYIFTKHP